MDYFYEDIYIFWEFFYEPHVTFWNFMPATGCYLGCCWRLLEVKITASASLVLLTILSWGSDCLLLCLAYTRCKFSSLTSSNGAGIAGNYFFPSPSYLVKSSISYYKVCIRYLTSESLSKPDYFIIFWLLYLEIPSEFWAKMLQFWSIFSNSSISDLG